MLLLSVFTTPVLIDNNVMFRILLLEKCHSEVFCTFGLLLFGQLSRNKTFGAKERPSCSSYDRIPSSGLDFPLGDLGCPAQQ